jgi:hypothetical protein
MVVPKLVCEASNASSFAWFVDVDGLLELSVARAVRAACCSVGFPRYFTER